MNITGIYELFLRAEKYENLHVSEHSDSARGIAGPPLLHMQCKLRTTNAAADHETLCSQGVQTTDLAEGNGIKEFRFFDNAGHEIGIIEI
ncbi:hypothetical protein [Brevibacillus sp. H7]|uniref:hypothetical protein n=1 Tax=Brevibacillus sp. H7 TaxID=3349138 RepID=UPI003B7A88FE